VTVLFIPTLELFLKMSSCKTADASWVSNVKHQDGTLRHSRFPEVQCFQGIHILHVSLSYIVIVVFLIVTYIITCCFYESRLGKSPVAK
jgi:cytochrome b subunit of formate dehydrogenase